MKYKLDVAYNEELDRYDCLFKLGEDEKLGDAFYITHEILSDPVLTIKMLIARGIQYSELEH